MTSVFFDAVKIVHDTGQQLTIDWTNFLKDGFLQIIQRTGFVRVNKLFKIPPKEKIARWEIGRARGATARPLTNTSYTNTRCSTGQVSVTTEVANTEEKNADHLVQKMSGSRGSPCSSELSRVLRFFFFELDKLEKQLHPPGNSPFSHWTGAAWICLRIALNEVTNPVDFPSR